jgi:hypothetical protein
MSAWRSGIRSRTLRVLAPARALPIFVEGDLFRSRLDFNRFQVERKRRTQPLSLDVLDFWESDYAGLAPSFTIEANLVFRRGHFRMMILQNGDSGAPDGEILAV